MRMGWCSRARQPGTVDVAASQSDVGSFRGITGVRGGWPTASIQCRSRGLVWVVAATALLAVWRCRRGCERQAAGGPSPLGSGLFVSLPILQRLGAELDTGQVRVFGTVPTLGGGVVLGGRTARLLLAPPIRESTLALQFDCCHLSLSTQSGVPPVASRGEIRVARASSTRRRQP